MSLSIAHSFQALYDALHSDVAIADRSASDARLRVSGPDRQEWLQGLLTNDIAAIARGQGCYASYLTPQGRMIGDMRVFNRGDDIVLDVVTEAREAILSRLDQFIIMEDVVLEDITGETGCVSVVGPRAAERTAALIGLDAIALEGLAEYAHLPFALDDVEGFCASTRELGVPGFDLYVAADAVAQLIATMHAGDVPSLDAAVLTTARIEAGRPRFGIDMFDDTIPLEAGLEHRAISFTKGCYVGQEVVIRVMHRGQGRVAKRLCWLVSEAEADEATAAPWKAGADLLFGGKSVGRLTSVCVSPQRKRALAIGMVHRDAAIPGTQVEVTGGGQWQMAVVEALPSG